LPAKPQENGSREKTAEQLIRMSPFQLNRRKQRKQRRLLSVFSVASCSKIIEM
jgi:hypothetical protein